MTTKKETPCVEYLYIAFFHGFFQVEDAEIKDVASHDIKNLEIPSYAFGFRFSKKVIITDDEESVLSSDIVRHQGDTVYYLAEEKEVYPLGRLKKELPSMFDEAARKNFWGVVKTQTGHWCPLKYGTIVIDPNTRQELWHPQKSFKQSLAPSGT